MSPKQSAAFVLIVALMLNMVLFAMQKIDALTFWLIIAAGFIIQKVYFKKE